MAKIVIYDTVHPAAYDLLTGRADVSTIEVAAGDEANLEDALGDADAILLRYLPLSRNAIAAAPRLKVIARHGVGYDNVDMAAANDHGVPVATIGDANAVTVAELALYFMLAAAKQGLRYDRAVREGDWQFRETADAVDVFQKKVLIIGFGRVGSRVAARCRAFEMEVFVCDPYIPQTRITETGCTPVADFRSALPEVDVVSLHVPLSEETRHMLDGAALGRMKESAILINTARGPIADTEAVGEALAAGRLFAAGFDVFDSEPPAPGSALLQSPRSVLTPHMGALTQECHRRSALRTMQNAIDTIDGRLDPVYVVNPKTLG